MSPAKMEKFETAIRSVIEFAEAFKRQDVEGMLALANEDCVIEDHYPAPDGTMFTGKEAFRVHLESLFRDSPSGRLEVEEVNGMGFRGMMFWRYDWADGTGAKKHIRGVDIFELKDRLISRIRSYVKG